MKWTKSSDNNNTTINNSKVSNKSKLNKSLSPPKVGTNNSRLSEKNSKLNNNISNKEVKSPKKKLAPGTYQEILYTLPNKPLDYSFREIVYMKDLINAIPRQGVRKQQRVNENSTASKHDVNNEEENFKESNTSQTKKKKQEQKEEVVESKIFGDKSSDINKTKKKVDVLSKLASSNSIDKVSIPKVIKYLPYTNAVILHSNSIKSLAEIDVAFIEILPEVEFLKDKVLNKSNSKNLDSVDTIPKSVNYSKIDLLQWIDLSHNRLESVHKDILKIPYLKILYLHANLIKDLEEIRHLSQCKTLINLTLHGNPIEHIKGYRLIVIELVATLEKLDFTLVSEKELDIIHYKGARFGEVRSKTTGEIVVFPQLDKEILKRMNIQLNNDKKDS
jgi:hypothetical protein